MKILFIAAFLTAAMTQNNVQERSVDSSALSSLLTLYYDVKNALVQSDSKLASAKSTELLNAVNTIDLNSLSESERKTVASLQSKLADDARHISAEKEISQQRNHFKKLSTNMFTLAKGAKLSVQPVYNQYCPMKEAYWLSNEVSIKNPYYGKEMLTCGEVKDTLK